MKNIIILAIVLLLSSCTVYTTTTNDPYLQNRYRNNTPYTQYRFYQYRTYPYYYPYNGQYAWGNDRYCPPNDGTSNNTINPYNRRVIPSPRPTQKNDANQYYGPRRR